MRLITCADLKNAMDEGSAFDAILAVMLEQMEAQARVLLALDDLDRGGPGASRAANIEDRRRLQEFVGW